MTDEQLRLTWEIFARASDLPAEEQAAFVQAASIDPVVVQEVLALLEESGPSTEAAPTPTHSSVRTGSMIGPYRITGLLGRGGMGEVYSARDTSLGRMVALKLLASGRETTDSAIARHIREAKAASSLNHPNIVSIYQVVDSVSTVAIAMELVEGNSFRQLSSQVLPLEHVSHFGTQIAQALAAAHRQGIIHRDIKPENLMVRPDGYVKVLDFGLAREIATDSWSTGISVPIGTLRYMSPEQARGETLTPATDVFSLGLVLAELATGVHPFAASSAIETAHAIVTGAPAIPSSLNAFVPPVFDQLIAAMLAKVPEARPSAAEVAEALGRIGRRERTANITAPQGPVALRPPGKAPPEKRFRKVLIWTAGIAAVAAAAAGIVRLLPSKSRQAPPAAVHLAAESELVSASGPDDLIPPRHIYGLSPDGALLVYVDDSHDDGGYMRWIAQSVSAPAIGNVNFSEFGSLLAGGDGVLYGIGKDGSVTYFRLLDPWRNKGSMRWSADSNTVIGKLSGEFSHLAALSRPVWRLEKGNERIWHTNLIRGALIWGVTAEGETSLFQHGWNAGGQPYGLANSSSWTANPPAPDVVLELRGPMLPPGEKCANCRLLEGGTGITFAITREGDLRRFRKRAGDGDWVKAAGKFARTEFGTQIGGGWGGFQAVLSEPGSYQIEGYVSTERTVSSGEKRATMSVAPGDVVKVRASTFSPVYSTRLLRLQRCRWDDAREASGLIDGLPVGAPMKLEAPAGGNFKKPQHLGMHRSGAGWASDGAEIRLPRDALSGIYAAELTTPSGSRYLAPFVVRPPPKRHNQIAIIANTTTWNAYNQWGGGSRFASFQPLPSGQPYELSFERPLAEIPWFGGASASPGLTDRGKREFNQLTRAEVWITTWMDGLADMDRRYSFDVYSDLDMEGGIPELAEYKVLILQTLPEFWTDRMRDNLEAYLATGGHLIYLGGRGPSERVRITEAGKVRFANGPGSGCTSGKKSSRDMAEVSCPAQDLFRWPNASHPDGRSERAILGLAHEGYGRQLNISGGTYFVVWDAHPFLTANTGLDAGSKFGNVRGINANLFAAAGETSSHFSMGICPELTGGRCGASHTTLAGKLLAYSEPNGGEAPITAASVVFRKTDAQSGWVFSIGSVSAGGVLAVDPTLQRIVRNALDSALGGTMPESR